MAVIFLLSVSIGVAGVLLLGDGPREVKVAVVVLDGADWTPLQQLREQKRVPTIERFIQSGVHGDLVVEETLSPISWTVIATGRSPQNVHISGWNTAEDGGRLVRQDDVKHKRLWDYLNAAGYRTGVVGWLLTWPVEPVDGFMISGPIRTSNRNVYHPPSAFNETEKTIIRNGSEWQEAGMGIRRMGRVDFLALGMKNLDIIQHHLWKFIEPEPFGMTFREEHDRYREFVYAEYENLDRVLSRFGEDWNVIVIGDSGYRPESEVRGWVGPSYGLSINPLIEALGYGDFWTETVRGTELRRHREGTKLRWCPLRYPMDDVVGPTTIRFRMCVNDATLNVSKVAADFQAVTYQDGLDVAGQRLIDKLVYREDEADFIGYMNVYPSGFVDKEFRVSGTDQPLVDGPVPFIDPALGITLPNGTDTRLWVGPEKSGDHPPGTASIFLADGPAFHDGAELPTGAISSQDIAPTILYMYGLPIPTGMDGHPATELFTDTFNARRTMSYTNMSTRKDAVQRTNTSSRPGLENALKQQLRDMGYVLG